MWLMSAIPVLMPFRRWFPQPSSEASYSHAQQVWVVGEGMDEDPMDEIGCTDHKHWKMVRKKKAFGRYIRNRGHMRGCRPSSASSQQPRSSGLAPVTAVRGAGEVAQRLTLFMGQFFQFVVYFQTSPMIICWSGAGWFYTGWKMVKYYVGLGWFHRLNLAACTASPPAGRMSLLGLHSYTCCFYTSFSNK